MMKEKQKTGMVVVLEREREEFIKAAVYRVASLGRYRMSFQGR